MNKQEKKYLIMTGRIALPFFICGALVNIISLTYKPSERETGIYLNPPAISYFESLKPNSARGTPSGNIRVLTDIDNDGEIDVEEIYSYMSPNRPFQINVKEGIYFGLLQANPSNLEKLTTLKKTSNADVHKKEYFDGLR